MSSWTHITGSTHRIAIAGKVVDAGESIGAGKRSVGGVVVTLMGMEESFARWLALRALQHGAAWERLPERPDRTRTAADGCFCFVDLPEGDYTLSFAVPGGEGRHGAVQRQFHVTRDADATIAVIELPPLGVRGLVQQRVEGALRALPLARVCVQGSREGAYSDEGGAFYLPDVEPGHRRIAITAPGFEPVELQVDVAADVIADVGVVELNPNNPPLA